MSKIGFVLEREKNEDVKEGVGSSFVKAQGRSRRRPSSPPASTA